MGTLHQGIKTWARFLQILEDAGPAWMVAVLYTTAAQNITTRDVLKNLLTANDPGDVVPVSGGLDTLARETVKCWKCGMFGHFAWDCPNARDCPKDWPDCPKEAGAGVHFSTTLNMLSLQEVMHKPHTVIAVLQTQVSLQHQLLATQATFVSRQDKLLSCVRADIPQGGGMPLASLTVSPAVAHAPMILGGVRVMCTSARIKA